MLANRIQRIRRLPCRARTYSSQAAYPFFNLRAYPFRLSRDEAIRFIAPYASVANYFQGFFRSIGARLLPGFGIEPLQPVQLIPTYFPGWVIDAEVELDVQYHGSQHKTLVQLYDSYIPGCDFGPVSTVSLFSKALKPIEPVPFTPELASHDGEQVACIPYTISPFPVIDIARTLSNRSLDSERKTAFVLSSLKPNLFAAYPVLFPLYLAKYEVSLPGSEEKRAITFFIEASSKTGRIYAEKLVVGMGRELREALPLPEVVKGLAHMLEEMNVVSFRGSPPSFVRFSNPLLSSQASTFLKVKGWMNEPMSTLGTASALASVSTLEPNDPRIREYTKAERQSTLGWLKMGAEIAKTKLLIEVMRATDASGRVKVVSLGGKNANVAGTMEGAAQSLQSRVAAIESKRNEALPDWWKSWLQRSQESSADKST